MAPHDRATADSASTDEDARDTTSGGPPAVAEERRSARLGAGIRVGSLLLALLIGVGIGVLLSSWASRDDTAVLEETDAQLVEVREATARLEERNWKLYRERELALEQLAEAGGGEPSSTGTTTTGGEDVGSDAEAGVFSDGVYLVPEEMPPGTYDGAVTGDFGYWARLKNTAGVVSSIEANGVVRGPFVLTVNPSDRAVELRGVVLTALE
jgi:hypothetical protein